MAEKTKEKNTAGNKAVADNKKKDRTFTFDGLKKEFKRIRWAKLKSTNDEAGVLANSASTFMFMAFFAAALTGFDALTAVILKAVSMIGG